MSNPRRSLRIQAKKKVNQQKRSSVGKHYGQKFRGRAVGERTSTKTVKVIHSRRNYPVTTHTSVETVTQANRRVYQPAVRRYMIPAVPPQFGGGNVSYKKKLRKRPGAELQLEPSKRLLPRDKVSLRSIPGASRDSKAVSKASPLELIIDYRTGYCTQLLSQGSELACQQAIKLVYLCAIAVYT